MLCGNSASVPLSPPPLNANTLLALHRPKLVGVKKKLDRREAVRERKALSAAKLERSIEAELIERLKSKAYGDAPLNVNEAVWQAVLDRERGEREGEKGKGKELEMEDDETDEEDEEELEEEEEGWGEREFVSDLSGEEDEDGLSDLEDDAVSARRSWSVVCLVLMMCSSHLGRKMTKTTRMMKTVTTKMVLPGKLPSGSGRHPRNLRSPQGRVRRRRREVSWAGLFGLM